MRNKFSISSRLAALGLAALFTISGQAMAVTTNLGMQAAPVSLLYANIFLAPQIQFYDDYLFAISPASVSSITTTLNLGKFFGINNLQARLYSGTLTTTGEPSGLLLAWSNVFSVSGTSYSGTAALISPITLGAGNYILQIRGDVVGISGGKYEGVLNISPVPDAAEWVLLSTGLSFMGFVAARRRRKNAAEITEM